MDTGRQKTDQEIEDLNNMISQLDLTDIYRALNNSRLHTLLKHTQTILHEDHETNLNKFKRNKIRQSMFSDHSGINLEISNTRKLGKFINM